MASSSPAAPRRSYQWSSPQRSQILAELIDDDRNSEARHRQKLEAAKREHDRVREEAERVIIEHQKREERQRLLEEKRKEEERIRLEEQIAAERLKLLALKDKKVEIPDVPPETQASKAQTSAAETPGKPTPPASQPSPAPQANGTTAAQPKASPLSNLLNQSPAQSQPASSSPLASAKSGVATTNGPASTQTSPLGSGNNLFGTGPQINGMSGATAQPKPAPATAPTSTATPPPQPTVDRYTVIHQNLKALRKSMKDQLVQNSALKARMGDMRREIVKSMGQLTNGAGANKKQQEKIRNSLREAMANQVQSQLVDPGLFTLEPRNPVQGATRNEPQLPSLFLYLINIFAKAAIKQFIVEGGANPETADPIGVMVAFTFSDAEFHWRGASLIDILIAKFRIVCPVLFGYRGSEKTEQGRARLGWWKDESGRWIDDQSHMNRMMGLGSGFAAISLRKFGKSSKKNPYPPRNYWTAMAKIVNTPSAEISNTQCLVLKAMIENYEQRFIEFYGTAAIAALKTALIDFPARAPTKSSAVSSLEVVAQLLKRSTGLSLA